MKILVFTAKWIGVSCARHLLDNFPQDSYEFVLCEPDSEMMSDFLKSRGLPFRMLTDTTISEIESQPQGAYDWLLNLWGGHIFKPSTLVKVRNSVNIHPAYLPYCRGRDPVVWAIRNGLPSGATLHQISSGVDEGPIWCRKQVEYEFPIRGVDLYNQVVDACVELFCLNWKDIRDGQLTPQVQSSSGDYPTYRRKDLIEDRCVNLDKDPAARELVLRMLSHDFSPDYTLQIKMNGRLYELTAGLRAISVEV